MTFAINQNKQFNSLEIEFNERPSVKVREVLKSLKFRWHSVKKVWYGYSDVETVTNAIQAAENNVKPEAKVTMATDEEIRAEYFKIWNDQKMVDYCTKKVAFCVKLPSGEFIPIEKRKIITRFCFGESGYDFDEAVEMAEYSRKSEKYFKHENMQYYAEFIQGIEEHLQLSGDYLMTIRPSYNNDCKIRNISFERITKILNDLGGSAHIESLKLGQVIVEKGSGRHYRIITDEEAKIILSAYKKVALSHSKKVDTYLKRYGLNKVHSWTYWRDA